MSGSSARPRSDLREQACGIQRFVFVAAGPSVADGDGHGSSDGGRAEPCAAARPPGSNGTGTHAKRSRRVRVAAGVVPDRKLVRHREGGACRARFGSNGVGSRPGEVGMVSRDRLCPRSKACCECGSEESGASSSAAINPPFRSDLRDGIPKPERRLGEQHGSLKIVFGPSLVVHARSSTQRARPPLHLDEIPVAELTGRSPTDAPAASSHAPLTSPDTTR